MNSRENFASWINKIRVRECSTEWLEWQTYNVANADSTRCTWIPDARLKLRIGSWLVGGNAVNFHCLRADMHLEGCTVKV